MEPGEAAPRWLPAHQPACPGGGSPSLRPGFGLARVEQRGPLHLLRANLSCPLPLKPIGQAPYEAPMREVRAFDPGHCLYRTLEKTWGPPFSPPASNKKLGSGGARHRSKKAKRLDF